MESELGVLGLRGSGRRCELPFSPITYLRSQGCHFQPQSRQLDLGLETHPVLKPSGHAALAAATEGAAIGKALLVLALQRAGNNTLLIGKQALG